MGFCTCQWLCPLKEETEAQGERVTWWEALLGWGTRAQTSAFSPGQQLCFSLLSVPSGPLTGPDPSLC